MSARQLVLIRHSKAAEGDVDVSRPLAPRGRKDAAAVGKLLKALGAVPGPGRRLAGVARPADLGGRPR